MTSYGRGLVVGLLPDQEGRVTQTSVELDEEQARLLQSLSIEEGRSIGDMVRQAISEYLARRQVSPEPRVIGPRREIPYDEWRSGFEAALRRIRAGVPKDMTPQEIEDMITEASEEARQERIARRQSSRA
jgi:hypothetical protein